MSHATVETNPWALLAYTIADDHSGGNLLDASVKEELTAIFGAADFGQVNVAAQVDFKRTPGVFRASLLATPPLTAAAPSTTTAAGKTRDFDDVRAEDHPLWRKIRDNVRQSRLRVQMGQTDLNSARANVLHHFLCFGQQECPADRYVVFFYGHSSGPMGLFYDTEARQRVPNTLRLNDLAGSIQAVDGLAAVVVFRDCFMNTLETAYELKGVGEFMIASQSEMPIAGIWPWLPLLTTLLPGARPRDVARSLAMQIGSFLDVKANRGPFADAPISLIDLSAAHSVAGPLKALADALEEARRDPERCRACADALEGARVGDAIDHSRPGDPALLDVPTMCENLQKLGSDPVAGPAKALGDAVRGHLVGWHHSQKRRYRGTSIYYKPVKQEDLERSVIESGDSDEAEKDALHYRRLALNTATGWDRIALNPLIPCPTANRDAHR
jgi:Clostripain family